MIGEVLSPPCYKARRNRLRPYMHKPPLRKLILAKVDIPSVNGIEYILCPRHQKPHYGTLLSRYGFDYRLRLGSLKQYCLTAHQEASEPVHLGSRMIQRRDAQEHIILGLTVMSLLYLT